MKIHTNNNQTNDTIRKFQKSYINKHAQEHKTFNKLMVNEFSMKNRAQRANKKGENPETQKRNIQQR